MVGIDVWLGVRDNVADTVGVTVGLSNVVRVGVTVPVTKATVGV